MLKNWYAKKTGMLKNRYAKNPRVNFGENLTNKQVLRMSLPIVKSRSRLPESISGLLRGLHLKSLPKSQN